MISWPDDLVRDIALRRCALVLGSGISANSTNASGQRPKTWEQFLKEVLNGITDAGVKRDIAGLLNDNDYLTACELAKATIGNRRFVDKLVNEFHTPNFTPALIHSAEIHKLDQRVVITPNIDNIYDRHAQHIDGTTIIKRFYDDDVAQAIRRLDQRVIIKMHGSVETPNKVIFTRGEYAKARSENSNFYRVMDALAITHTFLFLGCGFNDPDIRLMLEDYGYKFQYTHEHYFVSSASAIRKNVFPVLEKTMNVQILKYNPKDNHLELLDSIKELNLLVEAKRVDIANFQNW